MYLFFDTETTDMYDFKAPPSAEHQPYMVQFAALLCDKDGNEHGCWSMLIWNRGKTVSEQAAKVHGITQERIEQFGVLSYEFPFHQIFIDNGAEYEPRRFIGHNVQFDLNILHAHLIRNPHTTEPHKIMNAIKARSYCTMHNSTNICKIPSSRGHKWPKLSEAYKFFTGKDIEGAHDALVDVRACKEVFFALKERRLT